MMKRETLKQFFGERGVVFTGRVYDTGIAYDRETRSYKRTILVREVSFNGVWVTDHAWIKPMIMPDRELNTGELISFSADIEKTYTGYREASRVTGIPRRNIGKRNLYLGYSFTNVKMIGCGD
jgi:hypothetical protein